jgi:transglutaminase-like putative cysteine protease
VKLQIHARLDYAFPQPSDVLLQIEVAASAGQIVEAADLAVTPAADLARVAGHDGVGTRAWLAAQGRMTVDYRAAIAIDRAEQDWAQLSATPFRALPDEAVQYLFPSRYCPANRFAALVERDFGSLEGGAKVAAMRDWVAGHLSYVPGASDAETTAAETFHARAGVCRDYAHLMIALVRAADIPARFASVYAPRVDPPDFHAVAEVFLGGAWHLVDATGMARAGEMAVIGVGRDSGDVAFMTAFGPLEMHGQSVSVEAV